MTDARNTQEALELWTQTTAPAQMTQIGAEMWGTVTSGNRIALLTQIALEEWAKVPVVVTGGQTAVSINTG